MKFNTLFSFGISLLGLAFSADIPREDGVLVLTDSNFADALAEYPHLLVEFYAPWCGHCKKLAPEWSAAATTLSDEGLNLGKLDATENQATATEFGVKGYPTIKYFREGEGREYDGGRTASEIVSWYRKKASPATVPLSSTADLASLKEKTDTYAIAVTALPTDSAEFKAFVAAAGDIDHVTFATTSSPEVAAALGVSVSDNKVVLVKPFDNKRDELTLGADIKAQVTGAATPLVQTFSKESANRIFSSPIKTHMLIFTDADADYHATAMTTASEVAAANRGKLLVVNIPASENRILEYFGVQAGDLPAVHLTEMGESSMKKYKYGGGIATSELNAFVGAYYEGALKPTLKTEEVDASDAAGNVVVLRGKSFGDIVLNNDKDVFVEFYAPWCGHCKSLEPKWLEVGDHFAADSDVVIAKMDATANEVDAEGVAISGFPTLYFFRAGEKSKPMRYEGARETEEMVSFVDENRRTGASATGHDEL